MEEPGFPVICRGKDFVSKKTLLKAFLPLAGRLFLHFSLYANYLDLLGCGTIYTRPWLVVCDKVPPNW